MTTVGKLAVILPGTQPSDGRGRIKITSKTYSGLLEYQRRWQGEVTVVTRTSVTDEDTNLGGSWFDLADLPFRLETHGSVEVSIHARSADVTLAPHTAEYAWVIKGCRRPVFVTENLSSEWIKVDLENAKDPLSAARIRLGWMRQERVRKNLAANSAGIQCNGLPVWDAYRHLSPNPLLYFDTRLRGADVARTQPKTVTTTSSGVGATLRLGFSGRYLPIKGPEHVLAAQRILQLRGVPHTLHMIGSGPMDSQLRDSAAPQVVFSEPMDFNDEWVPWVRDNLDLMVLPHTLGDPSGTYLESAGVGVPIVGFGNVALRSLVREFNLGWHTTREDPEELANLIEFAARHRDQIEAKRNAGIDMMREHNMDEEFGRRVDHLQEILRAS